MEQSDSAAERLGSLIKAAREAAGVRQGRRLSQEWLGEQCRPTRKYQRISQFEGGKAVPDVAGLVEIFDILHRDNETTPLDLSATLAKWLTAWLSTTKPNGSPAFTSLFDEALSLLASQAQQRPVEPASQPLTSLAQFPGADPLTIIMGDRREQRVTSAADCLIYSGSITDAMYLPCLDSALGRALIRSDKLLVRMPQEYLEDEMPEIAERNLLIVGSPAVNWGARILNKGAIFPFRIDQEVVRQSELLLQDDRMQDEDFASTFWSLAQNADENGVSLPPPQDSREEEQRQLEAAADLARQVLNGSTVKAVMNKFRTLGVLDPADQENHGTSTHTANDFAVATLARNPYSKSNRYRAVICAGIHGPGTAAALRELLENPGAFSSRQLGAVLEVKLRTDLAWPNRFERAKVSPQTKEYTPKGVLQNIENALRRSEDDMQGVYKMWDKAALADVAQFIREIIAEMDTR